MGIIPKWPLQLRAEPRLWGAVVTNDPKNPQGWLGKRIEMRYLLGQCAPSGVAVRGADGGPCRSDGRAVWLMWRGTREGRLMTRVRHRWLRHRTEDGTLDIVCGDPGARRTDRWMVAFFVFMTLGLGVTLYFAFVAPLLAMHPSQRTWLDWPVVATACVLFMSLPVLLLWMTAGSLRRTCAAYRLRCDSVLPLDGLLAGQPQFFADVTGFKERLAGLISLELPGRTLLLARPPVDLSLLLRREEEQQQRRRSMVRRVIGYCLAGGVLYVAGLLVTQPLHGMPLWKPLLSLVGLVAASFVNVYGQRWSYRAIAAWERRRRQRKNRHEAAAGRPIEPYGSTK